MFSCFVIPDRRRGGMRKSNGEVYKHIVPIYIAGRDTPKVEMSLPAPGGEAPLGQVRG